MKNFNLSSLTKYLRVFKYGDRLRPARDWFGVLILGAILLVASVGWNVWLFVELANGQNVISGTTVKKPATPTVSVTGVQDVFKQRAAEETNYQHTYHFVDPSVAGS